MGKTYWKKIKEFISFLEGTSRAPRCKRKAQPQDMDDIGEVIVQELSVGDSMSSSSSEQPTSSYQSDIIQSDSGSGFPPIDCMVVKRGLQPDKNNEPRLMIVEQPKKYRRFRYKSEIDSAGSIRGVCDDEPHIKSFPKLMIENYTGPALIVVWLVTKEEPYRMHPALLVNESHGEMLYTKTVTVTEDRCVFDFQHLGIQYVTEGEVRDALTLREQQFHALNVKCVLTDDEPLKHGFAHKSTPKSIDLHVVRLCFHVFKLNSRLQLAPPVVSNKIFDSKKFGELKITKNCLKCTTGLTRGGNEILFFCKEVNRKDIFVVFYEMENGVMVWEKPAIKVAVHNKTGISCTVPAYRHSTIQDAVTVYFQLRRPIDGGTSNSVPYIYTPDPDDVTVRIKQRKTVHPGVDRIMNNWTQRYYNIENQPNYSEYDQYRDFDNMRDDPVTIGPSFVNLAVPGRQTTPFLQVMRFNQRDQQDSDHVQLPAMTQNVQSGSSNMHATFPNMQTMSSNMHATFSNMQDTLPKMQATSSNMHASFSNMQTASSNMHATFPNMQNASSNIQTTSSNMQTASSNTHATFSNMQGTFPNMQTTSPNMQIASSNMHATFSNMQATFPNMQGTPSNMHATSLNGQALPPFKHIKSVSKHAGIKK